MSVGGATRFENCGRDFAKRKQSDAEFAGNTIRMVIIIDRLINTLLGGLTLDPAGMHCPSWDDAFVSSLPLFFFCLSRSESGAPCVRGVHSSNKHCVAVYRPISTTFSAFFTRDCSFRHATQFSQLSLGGATIFAKLRSKFLKSLKVGGQVCVHHFVYWVAQLK